jgi:lysophospholipase L1-like esterase
MFCRHSSLVRRGFAALVTLAGLVTACGTTLAQTPAAPGTPPPAATAEARLPAIIVVGDSTARNNANGAQGWGDPFASFFDPAKVRVLNRARAGRSSRTFVAEGLWDRALEEVRAGDTVLIQFGHNDSGPVEGGRARGSLPGVGEETREVTNTAGAKETVHTFGWYLRKMIADVRAKGATPVLLSLTVRNLWAEDGLHVERGGMGNAPSGYGAWAAQVARAQGVAFVDLNRIVADRYDKLGKDKVKALFGPDYAHTSPAGAELNAESVIAGLRGLKGDPMARFLSPKGEAVKPEGAAAPSPTAAPTGATAPASGR